MDLLTPRRLITRGTDSSNHTNYMKKMSTNTKRKITPVKSRDPKTVRLEQSNIDGVEVNDLKNNF